MLTISALLYTFIAQFLSQYWQSPPCCLPSSPSTYLSAGNLRLVVCILRPVLISVLAISALLFTFIAQHLYQCWQSPPCCLPSSPSSYLSTGNLHLVVYLHHPALISVLAISALLFNFIAQHLYQCWQSPPYCLPSSPSTYLSAGNRRVVVYLHRPALTSVLTISAVLFTFIAQHLSQCWQSPPCCLPSSPSTYLSAGNLRLVVYLHRPALISVLAISALLFTFFAQHLSQCWQSLPCCLHSSPSTYLSAGNLRLIVYLNRPALISVLAISALFFTFIAQHLSQCWQYPPYCLPSLPNTYLSAGNLHLVVYLHRPALISVLAISALLFTFIAQHLSISVLAISALLFTFIAAQHLSQCWESPPYCLPSLPSTYLSAGNLHLVVYIHCPARISVLAISAFLFTFIAQHLSQCWQSPPCRLPSSRSTYLSAGNLRLVVYLHCPALISVLAISALLFTFIAQHLSQCWQSPPCCLPSSPSTYLSAGNLHLIVYLHRPVLISVLTISALLFTFIAQHLSQCWQSPPCCLPSSPST